MGRGTRRGYAGCESLPKQRKSAEKVEIPVAAGCESLLKQRKSAEKGREIRSRRSEISTPRTEIPEKGRGWFLLLLI